MDLKLKSYFNKLKEVYYLSFLQKRQKYNYKRGNFKSTRKILAKKRWVFFMTKRKPGNVYFSRRNKSLRLFFFIKVLKRVNDRSVRIKRLRAFWFLLRNVYCCFRYKYLMRKFFDRKFVRNLSPLSGIFSLLERQLLIVLLRMRLVPHQGWGKFLIRSKKVLINNFYISSSFYSVRNGDVVLVKPSLINRMYMLFNSKAIYTRYRRWLENYKKGLCFINHFKFYFDGFVGAWKKKKLKKRGRWFGKKKKRYKRRFNLRKNSGLSYARTFVSIRVLKERKIFPELEGRARADALKDKLFLENWDCGNLETGWKKALNLRLFDQLLNFYGAKVKNINYHGKSYDYYHHVWRRHNLVKPKPNNYKGKNFIPNYNPTGPLSYNPNYKGQNFDPFYHITGVAVTFKVKKLGDLIKIGFRSSFNWYSLLFFSKKLANLRFFSSGSNFHLLRYLNFQNFLKWSIWLVREYVNQVLFINKKKVVPNVKKKKKIFLSSAIVKHGVFYHLFLQGYPKSVILKHMSWLKLTEKKKIELFFAWLKLNYRGQTLKRKKISRLWQRFYFRLLVFSGSKKIKERLKKIRLKSYFKILYNIEKNKKFTDRANVSFIVKPYSKNVQMNWVINAGVFLGTPNLEILKFPNQFFQNRMFSHYYIDFLGLFKY